MLPSGFEPESPPFCEAERPGKTGFSTASRGQYDWPDCADFSSTLWEHRFENRCFVYKSFQEENNKPWCR